MIVYVSNQLGKGMSTIWSNIFMGFLISDSLFTPNLCVGNLVPRAIPVGTGVRKLNREGLVKGCQATRGMHSKRIQFFLMGSWSFPNGLLQRSQYVFTKSVW